eukprot:1306137-Amphidinium_carterae.1
MSRCLCVCCRWCVAVEGSVYLTVARALCTKETSRELLLDAVSYTSCPREWVSEGYSSETPPTRRTALGSSN